MSNHTGPGAFLKNFLEKNYGKHAQLKHMQERLETCPAPHPMAPLERSSVHGPEFEFDEED